MRVLVTGANGFVGAWLVRKLIERGDAVKALVRRGSDVSALDGLEAERVHGDVTDAASLEEATRGVERVFHLAGIRRAAERKTFLEVNAEGTRKVCEAMVKAGARRLVLCGSLAASGPSTPERPLVESDPFRPTEWYGESKAAAEQIAFGYRDRLEVAVARPARITGPGDHENLAFFKLVKKGIKPKVTGRPRPMSMVDVDDVVDLLVLLGEKREAVGQAFFSTGGVATLPELLEWAARSIGAKARNVPLPPAVLYGLAITADGVSKITGKRLPLNRKLARQLLAPAWTCSGEKATRLLGHRPRWSIESSVARSGAWYLEQGWL